MTALLLAAGCQGDDVGDTPCDPLAAQPQPIVLGEILGIGRDAAGTLYVADETASASDGRVFISDGDVLVRQRVLGGGSSSVSGVSVRTLTIDGREPLRLLIETGPSETRMALARTEERVQGIDDLGSDAELLKVLDEDSLDGLELRNLPGDVEIEYLVETERGELLLVVRPADEELDYDDFRLFFGPPERLLEREVETVLRQRDGGTTNIFFRLNGDEAEAFFPTVPSVDGFQPGPAVLTVDDRSVPLTRVERDALERAEFRCLA
jgi:hypothetical protein